MAGSVQWRGLQRNACLWRHEYGIMHFILAVM
jgi:hypothetical protein